MKKRCGSSIRNCLTKVNFEDEIFLSGENCNAPKIPYNFYNNFIIYSGYELSQLRFSRKIDKLTNYENVNLVNPEIVALEQG